MLISSHHFFNFKNDGFADKLNFKFRLVPPGNQDAEKDDIRGDAMTAQFVIIRLVLSAAVTLGLRISSFDVKYAFLQAMNLYREVYVRPQRGWTDSSYIVWKLLKPSYGLVDSGRLWQLTIDDWLFEYGFETVGSLTKLFILRDAEKCPILLIAKVVDDLLVVGEDAERRKFHEAFASKFKIGRTITDNNFIFNRLGITQNEDL